MFLIPEHWKVKIIGHSFLYDIRLNSKRVIGKFRPSRDQTCECVYDARDRRTGYGVFATKEYEKGDFLLEYCGERINEKMAESREKKYAKKNRNSRYPRCYMYYYRHDGKVGCIDATNTQGRAGHIVNDAVTHDEQNSKMKKIVLDGVVHLALFATKSISIGSEILYDYGVDNLWWRKPQKPGTFGHCLEEKGQIDTQQDQKIKVEIEDDQENDDQEETDDLEEKDDKVEKDDQVEKDFQKKDDLEETDDLEEKDKVEKDDDEEKDDLEKTDDDEEKDDLEKTDDQEEKDDLEETDDLEEKDDKVEKDDDEERDDLEETDDLEEKDDLEETDDLEEKDDLEETDDLEEKDDLEETDDLEEKDDLEETDDQVEDNVLGFWCKFCPNQYRVKVNLRRHIETCHIAKGHCLEEKGQIDTQQDQKIKVEMEDDQENDDQEETDDLEEKDDKVEKDDQVEKDFQKKDDLEETDDLEEKDDLEETDDLEEKDDKVEKDDDEEKDDLEETYDLEEKDDLEETDDLEEKDDQVEDNVLDITDIIADSESDDACSDVFPALKPMTVVVNAADSTSDLDSKSPDDLTGPQAEPHTDPQAELVVHRTEGDIGSQRKSSRNTCKKRRPVILRDEEQSSGDEHVTVPQTELVEHRTEGDIDIQRKSSRHTSKKRPIILSDEEQSSEDEYVLKDDEKDTSSSEEMSSEDVPASLMKRHSKKPERTAWSKIEKEVLETFLMPKVRQQGKPPRKSDILFAMAKSNGKLQNRNWKSIKFQAWAMYQQEKRKKKEMVAKLLTK